MFIRLLFTFLSLMLFNFTYVQGEAPEVKIEYLMFPAAHCKNANTKFEKDFCSKAYVPKEFTGRPIEVRKAKDGLVTVSSNDSYPDDYFELLCYRCTFSKVPIDQCGRFKPLYGLKAKAETCPALD